jgi:copper chaperone
MVQLQVKGMTCGHCLAAVKQAIAGMAPVAEVQVDLAAGRVEVRGTSHTDPSIGMSSTETPSSGRLVLEVSAIRSGASSLPRTICYWQRWMRSYSKVPSSCSRAAGWAEPSR